MRKLDFLITGVQKGGTSSVIRHLNQHKMIHTKFWSEFNFFNTEPYSPNYKEYHDAIERDGIKMAEPPILFGVKSPSTAPSRKALERVYEYNPKIKLLMFIREPIGRIYSQWQMYMRLDRFKDKVTKDFFEYAKSNLHSPHLISTYSTQIKNTWEIFGKENLYLEVSERIKKDPHKKYNEMFKFLGVDPMEKMEIDENIHVGGYKKTMSTEAYDYLYKKHRPEIERIYKVLGGPIEEWEQYYEYQKKNR